MSLLARCGISGPNPHFLLGNASQLNRKGQIFAEAEWFAKYDSDTIGYYVGGIASVATKDAELVRQITNLNYKNFFHRPSRHVRQVCDPLRCDDHDILDAEENQWRMFRSAISPHLSGSKLRSVIPLMIDSAGQGIEAMVKLDQLHQDVVKVSVCIYL